MSCCRRPESLVLVSRVAVCLSDSSVKEEEHNRVAASRVTMASRQGIAEYEIREALRSSLAAEHCNDPETLLLDEMVVCQGDARVDFAVVNSALLGYEIKSSYDTLTRLSRQKESYGRVFDEMTMVCAPSHTESAEADIPHWWGVIEVRRSGEEISLHLMRHPRRNPGRDPVALAELLWRDEALQVLESVGKDKGVRSKPRHAIWNRLSTALPMDELGDAVRSSIKARGNWRSAPRQVLRDGPSPRAATS